MIVKHLYKQRMATEAIEGIATEEMSESAICGGQVWQQLRIIILNLQYPSWEYPHLPLTEIWSTWAAQDNPSRVK